MIAPFRPERTGNFPVAANETAADMLCSALYPRIQTYPSTDFHLPIKSKSRPIQIALRACTSLFLGLRTVATRVSSRGRLVCGSSENTRSLKTEEEASKRQIATVPLPGAGHSQSADAGSAPAKDPHQSAQAIERPRAVGGNPLTRGSLAHLFRNRFYIGEVAYRGEVLPGEQPVTLDRKLFEAVQRKLDEQRVNHSSKRATSESLLIGRIFDDRGNRMTPSHARKNGKNYRYYLSSPLIQGQAERAGSVRRVPASEIETIVIEALRRRLKEPTATPDHDVISTHVDRVEVHAEQLAIKLARKGD
jgi:recombinase